MKERAWFVVFERHSLVTLNQVALDLVVPELESSRVPNCQSQASHQHVRDVRAIKNAGNLTLQQKAYNADDPLDPGLRSCNRS